MAKEKKITVKLHTYKGTSVNTENGFLVNPLYIRVTFNRKSTRFPFLYGDRNVYIMDKDDSKEYFLIKREEGIKFNYLDEVFAIKKNIIKRLIREDIFDKDQSIFTFSKLSERLEFYEDSIPAIVMEEAYNYLVGIAKDILTYNQFEKLVSAFKEYEISGKPLYKTLGINETDCYTDSMMLLLVWIIKEVINVSEADIKTTLGAKIGFIESIKCLNLITSAFAFNQLNLSVENQLYSPLTQYFSFNKNRHAWFKTETFKNDMDYFIEKWRAKEIFWSGKESQLYKEVLKHILSVSEFDFQSIEYTVNAYAKSNFS